MNINKSSGFALLICSLLILNSQVTAQQQTLTIAWADNQEDDLLAYKVYSGIRPGHYDRIDWVAGRSEHHLDNLRNGVRYYIAVSAVDVWGNESQLTLPVSAIAGDQVLPLHISLGENYPNPFNTETILEMNLPREMFADVVIYNSLGQKIRLLKSGLYAPGKHFLYWDGMNDQGNPAASGVYYYQLKSGPSSVLKKMLLIR